jgi:hypothetical protein
VVSTDFKSHESAITFGGSDQNIVVNQDTPLAGAH